MQPINKRLNELGSQKVNQLLGYQIFIPILV
jgi:hypothetical protein